MKDLQSLNNNRNVNISLIVLTTYSQTYKDQMDKTSKIDITDH